MFVETFCAQWRPLRWPLPIISVIIKFDHQLDIFPLHAYKKIIYLLFDVGQAFWCISSALANL